VRPKCENKNAEYFFVYWRFGLLHFKNCVFWERLIANGNKLRTFNKKIPPDFWTRGNPNVFTTK
jgi:hypothetical protein